MVLQWYFTHGPAAGVAILMMDEKLEPAVAKDMIKVGSAAAGTLKVLSVPAATLPSWAARFIVGAQRSVICCWNAALMGGRVRHGCTELCRQALATGVCRSRCAHRGSYNEQGLMADSS
jgi:hypothetical protein